jgi:hypothetical protein
MKLSRLIPPLRIAALGFAILVTLGGLIIAYENWHGPRALRAEAARLSAQGESLDYASYFPPRLPEEKNFMADPFLQMVDGRRPRDPAFAAAYGEFRKRTDNYWPLGRTWAQGLLDTVRVNERGQSHEIPPQEVLGAVASIEPQILRLRRRAAECSLAQIDLGPALMRRDFRGVNTDWDIGEFLQLSRGIAWQAAAESRLGKNAYAYADALVLMRMALATKSYPNLLTSIVEIGMVDSLTELFWQGCLSKSWSGPELEVFLNFFESAKLGDLSAYDLRAERALIMTVALTNPGAFFDRKLGFRRTPLLYLMRFGLTSENALAAMAGVDDALGCMDLNKANFDLTKAQTYVSQRATGWGRTNPYRRLGHLAATTSLEAVIHEVQVPPGWEVGTIVAALELYHRAHQDYPTKLEDLVPTYFARVPTGILAGTPPNYRRIDRANFRLTSGGPPEPAWEWHTQIVASEPASAAR